MNRTLAAGIGALALLSACQKKDDTAPDPAKVTLNITSPVAGQVFRSGDTVSIAATVQYPGELHGYEVRIVDTVSGYIVYDETEHIHTDHFVISDQWVGTATQPTHLKLTLIANIDHDGDDARKELNFEIVP